MTSMPQDTFSLFSLLHPPLSSFTYRCHNLHHHHHPIVTIPLHDAPPLSPPAAHCPGYIMTTAVTITHGISPSPTIYQPLQPSPNYQCYHVCLNMTPSSPLLSPLLIPPTLPPSPSLYCELICHYHSPQSTTVTTT